MNHFFSDNHPSTYLNCTLWDPCTNRKPLIPPVTQICCHVNSCPDRPRCSATRSNRRTEGINKFTFGLCASARLKFRGSLGWRVKLMIGVPRRKNQSLSNKQCSFASQTFLFPLVAWDLFSEFLWPSTHFETIFSGTTWWLCWLKHVPRINAWAAFYLTFCNSIWLLLLVTL